VTPMPEAQTALLQSAVGMVIPEAALVATACFLFVLAVALPRRSVAVLVGLLGVALAAAFAAKFGPTEVAAFGNDPAAATMAAVDPTGAAGFVRWLALASAALFLMLAWPELHDDNACEYVGCLLVMAAGGSLVGRANDLVSLFLSLEMVSIPTYVLLYLPTRSKPGQEAAVKYFLLSILSSAVLLFGFSYLYGLAGTTNLGAVVRVLTAANAEGVSPMASVAAVMVIAGLGFKVAAVPFHFYAPDVYQGGPTGVVAQLAVVPKVAGFVALARVFGLVAPAGGHVPFDADGSLIPLVLWVLAAATMTFGNVLALLQNDFKRLFAYSGIAHTGYMLIGLLVASSVPGKAGTDAVLFYLVAYTLMTAGAFAVLSYLNNGERPVETVADLDGLGRSNPLAAGLMAVFLFSLIGLPLTAGFAGKLLLFLSAFEVPASGPLQSLPRVLVLIAAMNAAVGAVYYLRAVGAMYLRTPDRAVVGGGRWPLTAALACGVATVVLGVYPNPLAEAARRAAGVPTTVSAPAKAVAVAK
jgi:NADH-quinone oxidoreductase subunit N